MIKPVCEMFSLTKLPIVKDGDLWVLLVAGSNGWFNYRHQVFNVTTSRTKPDHHQHQNIQNRRRLLVRHCYHPGGCMPRLPDSACPWGSWWPHHCHVSYHHHPDDKDEDDTSSKTQSMVKFLSGCTMTLHTTKKTQHQVLRNIVIMWYIFFVQ